MHHVVLGGTRSLGRAMALTPRPWVYSERVFFGRGREDGETGKEEAVGGLWEITGPRNSTSASMGIGGRGASCVCVCVCARARLQAEGV